MPRESEGWTASVPVRHRLVRAADAQDRRLVEGPACDLQANRETGADAPAFGVSGKAARHAQGRLPGDVEGNRLAHKDREKRLLSRAAEVHHGLVDASR